MSIELDAKDLAILDWLNTNGRATYSEIAASEGINLTVPAVKARIEKLQKIGVINHIGIYLNPHALTTDGTALIRLQVYKNDKDGLLESITNLPEVKEVFEALDEYNIVILTQIQPLSMHQLFFEELKANTRVKQAKLTLLLKEVLSRPHRIPKHNILLTVNCEYCGKQIKNTESYETWKINDIQHYLCCTSCLGNYQKWYKKQIS
ncbi:MAG: AsnC family transcriptional regulator [Candidatus Heimdallarchaeota archaeon]